MNIQEIFKNGIEQANKNLIKQVQFDVLEHKKGILNIAKALEPKFVISENNKELMNNLLNYFTGSEKSKFDLKKGIWLCGSVGVGKTFLLKSVFKAYTSEILRANSYFIFSYIELISELYKSKYKLLDELMINPVFIDDLGVSQIMLNFYGNELNFVNLLIDYRYQAFCNGKLTHVTTNLYPVEFREIVDERTLSRMYEMFNIIELKGIDYRKV